jgi:hypothetical protein
LVDRHNVTGLLSGDQTSSFGQRRLILLQPSPIVVGSSCAGDDQDRNVEPAARTPDLRHGLPNVHDFVGCGLVSSCAEPRRARELANRWSERFNGLAERDAEQSEDADR